MSSYAVEKFIFQRCRGTLYHYSSNRAQLPAVLAPPVEDAPADQRATQVTRRRVHGVAGRGQRGRNTPHHRRRGSGRAAGKLDAARPLDCGHGLFKRRSQSGPLAAPSSRRKRLGQPSGPAPAGVPRASGTGG